MKPSSPVCQESDAVQAPTHYNMGLVEVVQGIEEWGLPYHLGNVVKYVARAEHKGTREQDLSKAFWYLSRHIMRLAGNSHKTMLAKMQELMLILKEGEEQYESRIRQQETELQEKDKLTD